MSITPFNTTEKVVERATDGLAGVAVSSWFWMPSLDQISDASAQLLPVVGLVWLLIQIGYAVWSKFFKDKNKR